jgi:hypothetical protein
MMARRFSASKDMEEEARRGRGEAEAGSSRTSGCGETSGPCLCKTDAFGAKCLDAVLVSLVALVSERCGS